MAACWALEPAPVRSPLSCGAPLVLEAVSLPPSLEAPHAAREREPARAAVRRTAARVVLRSVMACKLGSADGRIRVPR